MKVINKNSDSRMLSVTIIFTNKPISREVELDLIFESIDALLDNLNKNNERMVA